MVLDTIRQKLLKEKLLKSLTLYTNKKIYIYDYIIQDIYKNVEHLWRMDSRYQRF